MYTIWRVASAATDKGNDLDLITIVKLPSRVLIARHYIPVQLNGAACAVELHLGEQFANSEPLGHNSLFAVNDNLHPASVGRGRDVANSPIFTAKKDRNPLARPTSDCIVETAIVGASWPLLWGIYDDVRRCFAVTPLRTPLPLARTVTRAGAIAVLAFCTVLLAHDDDQHHHDQMPPYDGPGYDAGTGGLPSIDFPRSGVNMLAWLPIHEFGEFATANDCWGYISPSGREYAIIGFNLGTGFADITNPTSPEIVAVLDGPESLWRDIKTYDEYAYAVSEGGGGIQVFDMTQIDQGTVTWLGNVTEAGSVTTTATHNVAINTESGYLYRVGGSSGVIGLRIYDLADPANPDYVGEWHGRYVHDAQIVSYTEGPWAGREVAFCASVNTSSGGGAGLDIVDVTDKSNPFVIGSTSYSWPAYAHQVWLTEDRQYAIVNDELGEQTHDIPTTTRVIDVSDLAHPFEATTFTNGNSSIGHNLYVRGDLSFHANYRSGLRVFDVSDPMNASEIGYFDTFPENDNLNFNGLWSNYPFFPSEIVIGSDIEKGLFVWWIGDLPLEFDYPAGQPEQFDPSGITLMVEISESEGYTIEPGSAALFYDAGDGLQELSLTNLGDGLYEANFPALECGTSVSYYTGAASSAGFTQYDPPTAPAVPYTALVASNVQELFADDFSDEQGWQVGAPSDDATAGIWERVDPIGTDAQPDGPYIGSACYVTGQHPGGGVGANDVDDGQTTLLSPVLDLSGAQDARISYQRWYSNHAGAAPGQDIFVVDITNDGVNWVNVETIGPTGAQTQGGWFNHEFRVSDFVALTDQVQLRFIAADDEPGSIVEAAVDAFVVSDIECESSCAADLSGDGVVNVIDMLQMLGDWGACSECPSDLTGDDFVNVLDLLELLGTWGACP